MQASLVLIQPDGAQRDVPVKTAKTLIGRNIDCGIRIPSSAVSRHHCELALDGETLTVRDLGSSNGTYVNRVLIKDQELVAGDVVTVGPATFVVRVDGEPEKIDSQTMLARSAGVGTSMDAPPAVAPQAAPKRAERAPGPASDPMSIPLSKPASNTGSKPAAKPASKPAGNDDSDEFELGNVDNEDSSVFDFDFKDDDNAPKL